MCSAAAAGQRLLPAAVSGIFDGDDEEVTLVSSFAAAKRLQPMSGREWK